ncbi:DegT/DnrJ/EryC1/StrS family aminotransferase [candidate division KSB1 bacterium]|nr:DegT/DnrJ/EryC1/StrS family aminotransferase [candidate division KSB1 bacterium]
MNVPFVDLKAQYETIKDEVHIALDHVVKNTAFILGTEVAKFEEEFADYCQAKYAVAVNSGTSALHLALIAAGVGAGDEVITVPNTFIATIEAILYTNAKPVLVDIDPDTYLMDPGRLEAAITERTKAIIPVHLYGQPVNMDPIQEIANRHNLVVIEDACQAHGAEYKNKRTGGLGKMGCFSFYPGKNLGAYGEGGMVVTDDEALYREMRILRDHGSENKYCHKRVGYNYRLTGFQGAILRVKLKYLDQWNERRRQNARAYNELLSELNMITPVEADDVKHVYHLYVIRTENRDKLQKYLNERGIASGLHYPIPVHLQEGYRFLGYGEGDFPITESYSSQILSLPMFAELSKNQIEDVVNAIKEWSRNGHQD